MVSMGMYVCNIHAVLMLLLYVLLVAYMCQEWITCCVYVNTHQ